MGFLSNIVVMDIIPDVEAEQSDEKVLTIVCDDSKATVAGFSNMSKYIIAGHEDGSLSQYDGKTGELLDNFPIHELNLAIVDLQWSADRTYFITACKDKTAKVGRPIKPPPTAPRTNKALFFLLAYFCPRPYHPEDLHRRHPPQQRHHHSQEGLCHPGRWPGRHGCHPNLCPTG
jgi:hypothetical protein